MLELRGTPAQRKVQIRPPHQGSRCTPRTGQRGNGGLPHATLARRPAAPPLT